MHANKINKNISVVGGKYSSLFALINECYLSAFMPRPCFGKA